MVKCSKKWHVIHTKVREEFGALKVEIVTLNLEIEAENVEKPFEKYASLLPRFSSPRLSSARAPAQSFGYLAAKASLLVSATHRQQEPAMTYTGAGLALKHLIRIRI